MNSMVPTRIPNLAKVASITQEINQANLIQLSLSNFTTDKRF